jgi:methyl-accepting chemotaxis protein
MDQVTQSNAANSEEAASASEELSAQSTELKQMVGVLTAIVAGGKAGGNGHAEFAGDGPRRHKPAQILAAAPDRRPARHEAAKAIRSLKAQGKDLEPEKVIPLGETDLQDF